MAGFIIIIIIICLLLLWATQVREVAGFILYSAQSHQDAWLEHELFNALNGEAVRAGQSEVREVQVGPGEDLFGKKVPIQGYQ